jgi:hypothetical protein
MEIGSGFRRKKGNAALLGNKEATKSGPVLEHKTPKNVLEDMLVGRRRETETRCNKNWHEGLSLGMTWQVRVRKVLSIVGFQERKGDIVIINSELRKEEKIKYRKSWVEPLEQVFCRIRIKARRNKVR